VEVVDYNYHLEKENTLLKKPEKLALEDVKAEDQEDQEDQEDREDQEKDQEECVKARARADHVELDAEVVEALVS